MSVKVAILGSGSIGTDLMIKIQQGSGPLELAAMVGIDPQSDGLARARSLGVAATHESLEGFQRMPEFEQVQLVFDATSSAAHRRNAEVCTGAGKRIVDLTTAAQGPFVIPVVNLDLHLADLDLNLVSCAGQATIPIAYAVSQVARLYSAEIVATIAAASIGPGTVANIDKILANTGEALQTIGGAVHGKATVMLDETEPPIHMQDYVICVCEETDEDRVRRSIETMIAAVQGYMPGYRLTREIVFEHIPARHPVYIPGVGPRTGLITQVFLEVKGAGDYLPSFAGNLDIMTSAALATAERVASRCIEEAA